MREHCSTSPTLSDTPLAQTSVQATLVTLGALVIAWLLITGEWFEAQHNAIEHSGQSPLLRIDLNHADHRELSLLPGVGPVLAQRIVENRNRQGAFESVEDLARVHGIGVKTIERLEGICEVSAAPPPGH